LGGAIAHDMLADHHRHSDAAVLTAFGDPGLLGARELFDIPVVGLAEAPMLMACMLGRRFAIVTFTKALTPWYEECVDMHDLSNRCAGVRALSGAPATVAKVGDENEDPLIELITKTISEGQADVIILGGAPLAGVADKIKARVSFPFPWWIQFRRPLSRRRCSAHLTRESLP
jgi:allantoin racemase